MSNDESAVVDCRMHRLRMRRMAGAFLPERRGGPGALLSFCIFMGCLALVIAPRFRNPNLNQARVQERDASSAIAGFTRLPLRPELPVWIASPGHEYFHRVPNDAAVAAGLVFRPLEETVRTTLADAETTDDAGMAPEREADYPHRRKSLIG